MCNKEDMKKQMMAFQNITLQIVQFLNILICFDNDSYRVKTCKQSKKTHFIAFLNVLSYTFQQLKEEISFKIFHFYQAIPGIHKTMSQFLWYIIKFNFDSFVTTNPTSNLM